MSFELPPIDLLSLTGRSKGIKFTPEVTNPIRRTTEGGGIEQRMAAQNREVVPKNYDTEPTGSSYVTGRGHFRYGEGFNPYFA